MDRLRNCNERVRHFHDLAQHVAMFGGTPGRLRSKRELHRYFNEVVAADRVSRGQLLNDRDKKAPLCLAGIGQIESPFGRTVA